MSEASPEQEVLAKAGTIAVIGLSRDPKRDSHIVANHLQRSGYRIVPVHPKADEILDEPAYTSIADIPAELAAEIDIIDVFRPAEDPGHPRRHARTPAEPPGDLDAESHPPRRGRRNRPGRRRDRCP